MLIIPFVGGPASGKSSTIERLKAMVAPEYAGKVHWIPEVFGLLFQNLPKSLFDDMLTPEKAMIRQWVICKVELLLANRLREVADENAIIITDRGFYDLEAYCTPAECDVLYNAIPKTEIFEHDFCVLFESDLSGKNLNSDSETRRIEKNQEENLRLAEKTRAAWENHTEKSRLLIIPQCDTMDEKAVLTAQTLNHAIGKGVFTA